MTQKTINVRSFITAYHKYMSQSSVINPHPTEVGQIIRLPLFEKDRYRGGKNPTAVSNDVINYATLIAVSKGCGSDTWLEWELLL